MGKETRFPWIIVAPFVFVPRRTIASDVAVRRATNISMRVRGDVLDATCGRVKGQRLTCEKKRLLRTRLM
eukprot:8050105-Pyramimonas_sp.AAC.1